MKAKHIFWDGLIFSLMLNFPNFVYTREAITFQTGVFTPCLQQSATFSSSYKWEDYSENYRGEYELRGDNNLAGTFGLGIQTRKSSGSGVRFSYYYRPKSKMRYTKCTTKYILHNTGFEYSENSNEILEYSLHTVSLSIMKYFSILGPLDLYLGGGGTINVLTYPYKGGVNYDKSNDIGFTGFPLIGLEISIISRIAFYGEYQYHFGRTLEDHLISSVGGITMLVDWHYSLNGPNILGGVNLYFGN